MSIISIQRQIYALNNIIEKKYKFILSVDYVSDLEIEAAEQIVKILKKKKRLIFLLNAKNLLK